MNKLKFNDYLSMAFELAIRNNDENAFLGLQWNSILNQP